MTALTASIFVSLNGFAQEETALVADFDSAQPQNNLGGEIEIWLKEDGSDTTQSAQMSFVKDDALGNPEGHALRVDYDVNSSNPAYNGVRTRLNHFDASGYKYLNFYVKGDGQKGFPSKIKIELIGPDKRPSPHIFEEITDEWQLASIALEEFMLIQDWTALEKFVVVFADIVSEPKEGAIYIDHIHFSD